MKMRDFVSSCLLRVDFKMENQRETVLLIFWYTTFLKKKKQKDAVQKLVQNYIFIN